MEQRIKILNEIFSNLQQITQWLPNNLDSASKYMLKAESLIEILEVEDCGSIGGYDPKSPVIIKSGFLLYDRFIALVNRHENKNDIKKCSQFDLENLGEYFKKLPALRRHHKMAVSGWVAVKDGLPKPLETVWLTNGKGWVSLGCRVEDPEGGWHWAESNGVVYIENGEIVAECESEDLDVNFWHKLPKPPCE